MLSQDAKRNINESTKQMRPTPPPNRANKAPRPRRTLHLHASESFRHTLCNSSKKSKKSNDKAEMGCSINSRLGKIGLIVIGSRLKASSCEGAHRWCWPTAWVRCWATFQSPTSLSQSAPSAFWAKKWTLSLRISRTSFPEACLPILKRPLSPYLVTRKDHFAFCWRRRVCLSLDWAEPANRGGARESADYILELGCYSTAAAGMSEVAPAARFQQQGSTLAEAAPAVCRCRQARPRWHLI